MTDVNRIKILNDTIASIEKMFGKGSIMRLGESKIEKIESISTGCISLDYALGVGGIPRGRIIEIFGPQSGGKTTISLHILAECQKSGGVAAFIDAEHSLSVDYAKSIGVNVDSLLLSQPDYGEQALEIVEALIRSGAIDAIVVDSVAALTPKDELEGNMGDLQVALQARLMSQALRKLVALTSKSKACLIFINQLRDNIGQMWGNAEVTPGGNALKFYSSIRIDVRRISSIKQGDSVLGNKTRIKIVKNKVAPPFKEITVDIIFGKGIDYIQDIIDLSISYDLIKKIGGGWYIFKDKKVQGSSFKKYLEENPQDLDQLKSELINKIESSRIPKKDAIEVSEDHQKEVNDVED
jgi:recombination protein RecA|uniref:Protein RecA n=1 Tax=Dictyoglomus turgidum TaxID=513050 RepID=A0A7C3WWX8_9BACT